MIGSIIVLGKTTFTYSLIFREEKLDTFLIDRQLNYEYDELLSLISTAYINNSKMLACFWGLDLNNISPNRQCFQIRFFPGNNVFNNSPSNPTIEQADTTGGKHLLVEKTSHYAFSSTSSFLTYTFCTISI